MKDFIFRSYTIGKKSAPSRVENIAENYELIDLYGDIFYLFLDRPGIFRLIVLPKIKIYKT